MISRVFAQLLLVLTLVAGGAAYAEDASTLNLQVKLDAGVIRVSDIWKNAGQKAASVVGMAPPPGRSFAIEAAQLAYIARLYDVGWSPVSGVERTTVERTGRPLERGEVLEPLRRSLTASGAAETMTVELANFAPVMVPPMAFPLVVVDSVAYDPASDRFSANLLVSSEGMDKQEMRVSGRVLQMGMAVVAVRRLQADDVIAATDVKLVQLPERRLPGDVARSMTQVVGQAARRAITVGQPIVMGDIGQPMMVAKGAQVVLIVETPGLSIAAQGLAMSPGGLDDTIQVMNPLSRAVVGARVTGPGRAVIAPGSKPLVPAVGVSSRSPDIAQ